MNEDHRPVCGYCCGTNEDLRAELSDTAATALAIDSELVEALAELALLKNGQDGWAQYTEEAATNARLRAELAEYRAESNHTWTVIRAGRDVAEAAIARVRELCDDDQTIRKGTVLRALEGNTEMSRERMNCEDSRDAEIDHLRGELAEADSAYGKEIDRLRAELTEARAMYVGAQADLNEAVGRVVDVRVELAEADSAYGKEIDRLRTELAVMTQRYQGTRTERDCEYTDRKDAEAAVARVRELCDHGPYTDEVTVRAAAVLRALDGAE